MASRSVPRFPLLALGMLSLLAALWAGLVRLGWELPSWQPALAHAHGPLMVSGFLGTLIGLERAVAWGRPWAYAVPLSTGVGALALIAGIPGWPGPLLMSLGSLGLGAVMAFVIRLQPALYTVAVGLGALSWLTGNALWLSGWPVYRVVWFWAAFLVLTIAGERLELSRLRSLSPWSRLTFFLSTALVLAGALLTTVAADLGARVTGSGLLMLGLWLLRYDVALRTVRQAGLQRFVAVCLISGYAWLGISGVLGLELGGVPAGPPYDALLHSLFLGFVMAMIFGHAPIIFPAVLAKTVLYRPAFYAHLVLLHVSLLIRVAGDQGGWPLLSRWGGLLNVLALLLFLANTARSVWLGGRPPPRS